MRIFSLILVLLVWIGIISGCVSKSETQTNPWLVPFRERHASVMSRSQMRAMVRLGEIYRNAGLTEEYKKAMTTAVELYAGEQSVTFELLNILIQETNDLNGSIFGGKNSLRLMGIDPENVTEENLPTEPEAREIAEKLISDKAELELTYEELLRIMRQACDQIPYNADLYYRTANLQYIRAEQDGDRVKYKDAINFLKKSIASQSTHLESYYLIAKCYEKLEDYDRAIRFWRMFETVYEVIPDIMPKGYLTPEKEEMHREAVRRIKELSEAGYDRGG